MGLWQSQRVLRHGPPDPRVAPVAGCRVLGHGERVAALPAGTHADCFEYCRCCRLDRVRRSRQCWEMASCRSSRCCLAPCLCGSSSAAAVEANSVLQRGSAGASQIVKASLHPYSALRDRKEGKVRFATSCTALSCPCILMRPLQHCSQLQRSACLVLSGSCTRRSQYKALRIHAAFQVAYLPPLLTYWRGPWATFQTSQPVAPCTGAPS